MQDSCTQNAAQTSEVDPVSSVFCSGDEQLDRKRHLIHGLQSSQHRRNKKYQSNIRRLLSQLKTVMHISPDTHKEKTLRKAIHTLKLVQKNVLMEQSQHAKCYTLPKVKTSPEK